MQSVTVTRDVDVPPDVVRKRIADVPSFMRAAGFDDVAVDGDRMRIANTVGWLFEIELDLQMVERDDAVLAYEQRDGIFEAMTTAYWVDEGVGGSTVRATTEFALDVAYAGPAFDATVVQRQRRAEITKQFDYLESGER